jgi:hypothetical protein
MEFLELITYVLFPKISLISDAISSSDFLL